MFQVVGQWVARHRVWVILGWLVLAGILMAVAPPLEKVSSTDQKDFLPEEAPFVHAAELQARVFSEQSFASSSMILVEAGPGRQVTDPEIWALIGELEAWLNSSQAPENLVQAVGPHAAPELAGQLVAPSGRVALIGLGYDSITDARETSKAVAAVDDWLAQHAGPGYQLYHSGEAALNAQAEASTFATMDRTLWITVVLVIVALLVIYRSPVSPLVPLLAVTLALLVSLGIIALLAEAGVIAAVTQVQAILVAVIYGAGTDYCLFLISRFREEMAQESKPAQAAGRTVGLVGETISSSAGTVLVGFMSLSFAEMGLFQSAGPMLAIGIAVSLLAGLTLVPALLACLGNRAFWPGRARERSTGRFYAWTSRLVSSRPLLTILLITAIMTPLSVHGLSRDLNYDMVADLPDGISAVRGYHLLQEEMGAGLLFPLTVVATGREPADMAAEMVALTEALARVEGVADVRGLHTPLGRQEQELGELLRVDRQLGMLLSMEEPDAAESLPADPQVLVAGMQRYLALIQERFPELARDKELATVQEILEGGLMSLMMRQEELMGAVAALAQRFQGMEAPYLIPPMGEGDLFASLRPVYDEYVAADGVSYRLEVVLVDPIGESGFKAVKDIRRVLEEYQEPGEAVVSGTTVVYTDIRDVMDRDMVRAFGFILAGVFLVLLLMLRSAVAPLYLIGTVLLSYTCTMGLTSLFFEHVMGVEKLSWMMPMFMFVFLVALGIDYSVFLFGRIKEEVGRHGIAEGVHVAVAATGAIISSAGIILAGTFAGLMAGELAFLAQLGFAVAVGVLIDTFLVRTVLDPALAILFGRWTWWPGGVPRPAGASRAAGLPAPEG